MQVAVTMQAAVKERVLLVDDEPQVLVALEDLLSDRFVIFKTESPEHALKIVEREPDLAVVITDQRMPRMTGDQLLTRLGGASHAMRILVTGFADLSAVVRAVNDGKIFAYVTKPWNVEDLQFKVQSAADQFRLGKELAYERQLLHDLMDNVPDGIYFKDEALRFRRVNRSFAAMLGVETAAHLVGRSLAEISEAASAAEPTEAEEGRILSDGKPAVDVLREYSRSGFRQWLSETKAPIRGPDGGVVGLVGIARDVTERITTANALRRSEERQRSLEEQLTQSQKMDAIGRLAGGVAHDFNNLLAVIHSYGELVLKELVPSDPKYDDVAQILSASERASGLTRQLLAFSRRQVVQRRPLQLNDVVSDVEKMLHRIIGEDIDLKTVLPPMLGTVKADAGQIEQIILNLTVNARDAMPQGGKLTIQTANVALDGDYAASHPGVEPGAYVMLAVTDTGTGMDAETQRRIFEPFFTTKEVGKGTGLGLSTVYGIVTQNRGHIWVESELGRGTAFKVYFPRVDEVPSVAPPRVDVARAAAAAGTILLVEDDEAVRRVTVRILRASGYTVIEARRAVEARNICAERGATIDLLLTDVVMPEVSGPKLAAEIALSWPAMRILFMSGYPGSAGAQDDPLAADAPYIEKPFTAALLTDKVREILTDAAAARAGKA